MALSRWLYNFGKIGISDSIRVLLEKDAYELIIHGKAFLWNHNRCQTSFNEYNQAISQKSISHVAIDAHETVRDSYSYSVIQIQNLVNILLKCRRSSRLGVTGKIQRKGSWNICNGSKKALSICALYKYSPPPL